MDRQIQIDSHAAYRWSRASI